LGDAQFAGGGGKAAGSGQHTENTQSEYNQKNKSRVLSE
jgi:hypothetical protein